MPFDVQSEREEEWRRTGYPGSPPAIGYGGGGGGGGAQDPLWELPGGVMRAMGGEPLYDMPLSLQSLLWSEALVGQINIDWSQMPRGNQAELYGWWSRQLRANPQLARVLQDMGYGGFESFGGQMQTARAMTEGMGDAQSGFLPEWEPFREELMGTLEEFAGMVPGMEEAFEGGLAARGVGGAGQATEARYRDVYGPVARAGAQATRQAYTDYLQMYQRGRFAEEDIRQASISRLTGAEFQAQGLRQAQEAGNLDRVLRAYLGEGELNLGYEALEQRRQEMYTEVAMHRFEQRMITERFNVEMRMRQQESRSKFWSDLFGIGVKAAGIYYLKKD